MSEVNSAVVARQKLQALLEAYAPMHIGRQTAMEALAGAVKEFEAAIREDERAGSIGTTGELSLAPGEALEKDADLTDVSNKAAALPEPLPPETTEGQPDAPVSIPEGSTDVNGQSLPETLPANVADSVAGGEPLREVSESPPDAPTNGMKKKRANR